MIGNRRVFRFDQYNNTSEKVHNHQYLQLMLILQYKKEPSGSLVFQRCKEKQIF
jgi:hypothetical protein